MGHTALLPLWRYWAAFHLLHNPNLWQPRQHARVHNSQILQHPSFRPLEWQPSSAAAMACRSFRVCGVACELDHEEQTKEAQTGCQRGLEFAI